MDRAKTLWDQGDSAAARTLLKEWLDGHGTDPDFSTVLRRYLGYQEGAETLLGELKRILDAQHSLEAPLYRWAAETAELMGDYSLA